MSSMAVRTRSSNLTGALSMNTATSSETRGPADSGVEVMWVPPCGVGDFSQIDLRSRSALWSIVGNLCLDSRRKCVMDRGTRSELMSPGNCSQCHESIHRSFLNLVGGAVLGQDVKKLASEVEGDMERLMLIHSLGRRVGRNKAHNEEQCRLQKSFGNFKRQKDAGMIKKDDLNLSTGWHSWATWKKQISL